MKVVTYNIQWGKGRDGKVDLGRIADTVRPADIICLQEVERHWRSMEHADQVARLAELLPEHFHSYAPSVDLNDPFKPDRGARRQTGLLTLSRMPILSTRAFPLLKYPVHGHLVEQAGLQELILVGEGQPLRVYNTHLCYVSQRQRQLQIAQILRIVADAPLQGGPVAGLGVPAGEYEKDWMAVAAAEVPQMPTAAMILGDFNMRPNSPDYDLLVGVKDLYYGRLHEAGLFADVLTVTGQPEDAGSTHPEEDGSGFGRIDHILVSAELVPHVKRAWIDRDADGSDHQPVFAELSFH